MSRITTSSQMNRPIIEWGSSYTRFRTSPGQCGPAIKFSLMKVMVDTCHDLVFRTAFRIMCDRMDAECVSAKVFSAVRRSDPGFSLQSEGVEDALLHKTCRYCYIKILQRRLSWLFGEQRPVFVRAIPEVDHHDDYIVKQAWQLYCRACFKMSPLQIIVYALSELECVSVERTASILGLTTFRVRVALSRAVTSVRRELSLYGSERQYHAYVAFIRQVH